MADLGAKWPTHEEVLQGLVEDEAADEAAGGATTAGDDDVDTVEGDGQEEMLGAVDSEEGRVTEVNSGLSEEDIEEIAERL